MSLALMQVFNDYFQSAVIDTLGQQLEKFNAASNGTLVLSTAGFTGDFMQESFWRGVQTAQRRVDRYATNAVVTPTDLTTAKRSSVKVAGGFGPIIFEPSQLTWLQKPTAEAIEVVSRNFAESLLSDQLNTLISALIAAISNQADSRVDVSAVASPGNSQITQSVLNDSHALFGDRSGALAASIMTGSMYHKLIGQNLANETRLFQAGNVRVVDILGRATVITDAPALIAGGKQRVLTLVPGAGTVMDAGDMQTNIETKNGKERIERTMQVDYTFGLSLEGYTWDEVNGGKSPTNAEIATGANWDRVAVDVKRSAGVVAIGAA